FVGRPGRGTRPSAVHPSGAISSVPRSFHFHPSGRERCDQRSAAAATSGGCPAMDLAVVGDGPGMPTRCQDRGGGEASRVFPASPSEGAR
uniref:Uncharacterized protein n=1 Tax=Triticum urartu TaxID=4572 RepID=A0A8R7R0G6_TRIUA